MGVIQELPSDLAEWTLELRAESFYLGAAGWTAWEQGDGPEPELTLIARHGELMLADEQQRAEFGRVLDIVLANPNITAGNAVNDSSAWTVTPDGDGLVVTGPVIVYGPNQDQRRPRGVIELEYVGVAELAKAIRLNGRST